MIFAMWHGGSGYGLPDPWADLETFPSVRAAGEALRSRAESGGWQRQTFRYADGRTEETLTPGADLGPSMTLYRCDPREEIDPYPSLLLEVGPRGGIRRVAT